MTAKQNDKLQQLYIYKNYSFNANLLIRDGHNHCCRKQRYDLLDQIADSIQCLKCEYNLQINKCFEQRTTTELWALLI